MPHTLTKSLILSGLQCGKRLYFEVNSPDQDVNGAVDQIRMQGEKIGELSRKLYVSGVLIESDSLESARSFTTAMLEREDCPPLFEATFEHEGVLVRADIVIPSNEGLTLIEVKSSTKVKKEHLHDCAVQHWVVTGAGYQVASMQVAHVNSRFVYAGGSDYSELFKTVEVLEEIVTHLPQVPKWVERFNKILEAGVEPEVPMGPHCRSPNSCPFQSHCQKVLGEWPVTQLPSAGKLTVLLQAEGITDIRDIPKGRLRNPQQERVRRVVISGVPELDPQAGAALNTLGYPRYYLDFETICLALPIWKGTRPYEQLPFQWSCHVEVGPDDFRHLEFLDTSGEPTMRAFAESLVAALIKEGPVLVYSGFEDRILREAANRHPDLAEQLNGIRNRLFDLLELARRHYCHPEMRGSWSLKSVLPTVAPELSYDDLEVQDGMGAQRKFLKLISTDISAEEREVGRKSLLEYCERDTLAMIRLSRFLESGGRGGPIKILSEFLV